MKKLEILTDPNPILREEARAVDIFDGQFQALVDDMVFTMRSSNGIGLAASQVGAIKQIIVAEYEEEEDNDSFPLKVIVNPKIEKVSDEQIFLAEGCLSFPGKELYIKRPQEIEISALDRWGKPIKIKSDGLLARVIEHEIDHLSGVLMIDHIRPVRTVFIGSGTLGVPALEIISDNPQFSLSAVITGSDRPAGRDKILTPTIIAESAERLKMKVLKIDSIKDRKAIEKIKSLEPELIVLADFGQKISEEIINLPKFGILNIHPSLLPKYRGPSPVVSAILAGEKKTGVSIIRINSEIDAGDILAQIEVKIGSRETAEKLKNRLANFGADLLAEVVPYMIAGEITPIKQNPNLASATKIFDKSSGKLSSNESSAEVDRMVRAFSPWPGVYTTRNDKRIFITAAHLDRQKKLIIDSVKPEGKREMRYSEYLAGNQPLTFGE
ncbi:MAG: methionyl-tRNA formyltransferase [Candidatus Berkelbacteria bacterium]|nr:methionyl-tRNA formyltransferase [Candidatus Berkelbacteria bacterium]